MLQNLRLIWSNRVRDGVEDIGESVTFAVQQHTWKESCQIKIWNMMASLWAKISAIFIKNKGNKPFESTPPGWLRYI